MPSSNNSIYDPGIVNTLYTAFGAQLLRVRDDKTPAEWRGWIDRQLTLDDALEHVERGGNLGLVPASIGMVAIDVDEEGDCDRLFHNFPPLAMYQTQRVGGVHAFYQHDGAPVRQRPWRAPLFRTAGDIRHGRGYVVLWRPDQLVNDLERGSAGVPFTEVEQALVTRPPAPQAGPKSPPVASTPAEDDSPPSPARLRHAWLKDKIIAARIDGMDGAALRRYAVRLHAGLVQPPDIRVPHRLPLAEALRLASWASGMRWDTEAQRRRGLLSGQARYAVTADRDAEIVATLAEGLSIRETARALGLGKSSVGRVKKAQDKGRLAGHPNYKDAK